MRNIFDEKSYAEELLKIGSSKYMNFYDITTLSKYYRYIGIKEKEIENLILEYCHKFYEGFIETPHMKMIERAIRKSKKYELRFPKDVIITVNEINEIRKVNNYRYEKVLFTLLAIAKHHRITSTAKEESTFKGYFVPNKYSWGDIFRHAHVAQKKGEIIFNILHLEGYIDRIEKSNSILIKFSNADDISESWVVINNMNKITEFYKPYCSICKKELVKNSNGHKFCNRCWKEKHRELERNRIKNKRTKNVGE